MSMYLIFISSLPRETFKRLKMSKGFYIQGFSKIEVDIWFEAHSQTLNSIQSTVHCEGGAGPQRVPGGAGGVGQCDAPLSPCQEADKGLRHRLPGSGRRHVLQRILQGSCFLLQWRVQSRTKKCGIINTQGEWRVQKGSIFHNLPKMPKMCVE